MTTKPDVTPKPKPAAKKKAAGVSASAVKARKPGRPSAYTKALGDSICSQIANGLSLRAICTKPGMPNKSTVLRWLDAEDAQQLRDQYARAREAQADLLAEEMLEIADDSSLDVLTDKEGNERPNTEFVTRSRLRVDTRKWLASKLAPKKYGDKLAVGGADDLPPIEVSTKSMTDAERAVRLSRMLNGNPDVLATLVSALKGKA